MDPIVNLARQRKIVQAIRELDEAEARDLQEVRLINLKMSEKASELAELVAALDEWRLQGGFDPYTAAEAAR